MEQNGAGLNGQATPDSVAEQSKSFPYKNSATLEHVAAELQTAQGWRYNERAAQLEYQSVMSGHWLLADEPFMAALLEHAEHIYWYCPPGASEKRRKPLHFTQEEMRRACLVLGYRRAVDPFHEWIVSLPPWDKTERLDTLLSAMFGAADTPLNRWASRYLCLAPIQRAVSPGCLLREMPVLIGPQGIGKSSLLVELFPKNQQGDWFSDAYSMHELDAGRRLEATLGAALVEISEMSGMRKAELERVKADLTRRRDRWRLAYRKDIDTIPRRFCFVGTSNDTAVLPDDPSGNTRFVPVECPNGRRVEPIMAEIREQLWAEAWHLYLGKAQRANLPFELRDEQSAVSEEYRDRDEVLEIAVPEAISQAKANGYPLTTTAIIEHLRETVSKSKVDQRRVRASLLRLGYVQQRRHGGRIWEEKRTEGE